MSVTATTAPTATDGGSRRTSPVEAFQQSLTLAWRAIVKIRRNPEQLLDVTLTPIVFIVLFTFLFGGAVAGDWHQYLQYLLPGILVQTVVFASVGTGVGLRTDIDKGVFDRFRSLPIARSAPLTGIILGDVVRYMVSGAVVLAFGSALGFRIHTNPLAALGAYVLVVGFALALCWVTAIIGLLAKTAQSVQGFAFLSMFPLTFGSNVFVQTNTLPGWLQAWVKVNPVTALNDAARGLLLGGPVAGPVLRSVAFGIGIVAVFAPIAVTIYRRRATA